MIFIYDKIVFDVKKRKQSKECKFQDPDTPSAIFQANLRFCWSIAKFEPIAIPT